MHTFNESLECNCVQTTVIDPDVGISRGPKLSIYIYNELSLWIYMYICKYVCKYLDLIWCIDCVFVTRKKKHIFRRSCPLSLPFLGQETPDVAETEKPGTEKAGTVVFYVFFQFLFFPARPFSHPSIYLSRRNPNKLWT